MAVTMWGQMAIQPTAPSEDPIRVGSVWVDTSGTATAKVCTSVSPYTFGAIYGSLASHDHTSAAGDGGALTNDEHDGYSEYTGISAPSAPAASKMRLYASANNGHVRPVFMDPDGTVIRLSRDNVLLIKNNTGSPLVAGQMVYIDGSSGNIPTVANADADDPDKIAIGMAREGITTNGFGLIITRGEVPNLDTHLLAEGTVVYLSQTAGAYTSTAPSEPAAKQRIGVVTRSHSSQGTIEVDFGFSSVQPRLHASTHQNGGTDEINVDGLSGLLADPQTPLGSTIQTTTSTGSQNNFSLSARVTTLICTNASALTITGASVGGSAPHAGDKLIIHNDGTSTVKVTNNDTGNSTAANCFDTPSTQGHIIGGQGSLYFEYEAGSKNRWHLVAVESGAFIPVAFNAGDFTGSASMTWTVGSGDVSTFAYQQEGKFITVVFYIVTTTIAGTPDKRLRIKIPGGFSATNTLQIIGFVGDNGTEQAAKVEVKNAVTADATLIVIAKFGNTNFAASTDNTHAIATITFEVD